MEKNLKTDLDLKIDIIKNSLFDFFSSSETYNKYQATKGLDNDSIYYDYDAFVEHLPLTSQQKEDLECVVLDTVSQQTDLIIKELIALGFIK